MFKKDGFEITAQTEYFGTAGGPTINTGFQVKAGGNVLIAVAQTSATIGSASENWDTIITGWRADNKVKVNVLPSDANARIFHFPSAVTGSGPLTLTASMRYTGTAFFYMDLSITTASSSASGDQGFCTTGICPTRRRRLIERNGVITDEKAKEMCMDIIGDSTSDRYNNCFYDLGFVEKEEDVRGMLVGYEANQEIRDTIEKAIETAKESETTTTEATTTTEDAASSASRLEISVFAGFLCSLGFILD